jgi:hypothetical protein
MLFNSAYDRNSIGSSEFIEALQVRRHWYWFVAARSAILVEQVGVGERRPFFSTAARRS